MELLLWGAAIGVVVIVVVVWQSLKRPMTLSDRRRRIQALDDPQLGRGTAAWVASVVSPGAVARVSAVTALAIPLVAGLAWMGAEQSRPGGEVERTPAPVVREAGWTVVPGLAGPKLARLDLEYFRLDEVFPFEKVFPKPPGPATTPVDEDPTSHLSVARSGVGTDVVDRELVGQSNTFILCRRVLFWTHVTGGRSGDVVRHVWLHGDRVVGAIELPVGGTSWRTYSRKPVAAPVQGGWAVEVQDSDGRVLARHEFECERRSVRGLTAPPDQSSS